MVRPRVRTRCRGDRVGRPAMKYTGRGDRIGRPYAIKFIAQETTMQPIKNWHWTEKLLLAGCAAAVVATAGCPLLAGPMRAAAARRMSGPMLDKIVLRVDEALQLNLTDTQQQAVKPVLVDAFLKMRQLRHDTKLSAADRHAALRELREGTRAKLAAILTTGQMAKLDAARARFDLGLSLGQKAQMKAVMRNSLDQARAIRDDGSLTSEQKRARLIDLHTATHAKVAAILTPEQQRKAAARFGSGSV